MQAVGFCISHATKEIVLHTLKISLTTSTEEKKSQTNYKPKEIFKTWISELNAYYIQENYDLLLLHKSVMQKILVNV